MHSQFCHIKVFRRTKFWKWIFLVQNKLHAPVIFTCGTGQLSVNQSINQSKLPCYMANSTTKVNYIRSRIGCIKSLSNNVYIQQIIWYMQKNKEIFTIQSHPVDVYCTTVETQKSMQVLFFRFPKSKVWFYK